MILGEIRLLDFLLSSNGEVRGIQLSDGKYRRFEATYEWTEESSGMLKVWRKGGTSSAVTIPKVIPLNESLVAFFGLYSGDGAKGSEDRYQTGLLRPSISFSQREPNLIRFAVRNFRLLFPEAYFTFSLGEDSAHFMGKEGLALLAEYYGGTIPAAPSLSNVKPTLNDADIRYLNEKRSIQENAAADLAFYYQHKTAMEQILAERKEAYIRNSGIELTGRDRVTASLRRPYKKGARLPGGSSRSDETYVGGVTGMGELFLKILHELEISIQEDTASSTDGLITWKTVPSQLGEILDINSFFSSHPFGQIAGERPGFSEGIWGYMIGQWRRSNAIEIARSIRITPLWCYVSGLYLAEGTTEKAKLFKMYRERVSSLALGFTSSEDTSLELILRALQQLFPPELCMDGWKVKVGSQYFPELVVIGLKNAVPMLRGGKSGDGKLRTMEISLEIKSWALQLAPALLPYADRYSHVEPTGAGIPRIDFWGSSSLCKWFFPLIMYATFGSMVSNPETEFVYD